MQIAPFFPPQRTLMGPGPSDVYPQVLQALAKPTIGHLDPLFLSMMDELKCLLQYAFQTENPLTIALSAPVVRGWRRALLIWLSPVTRLLCVAMAYLVSGCARMLSAAVVKR